MVRKTPLDGTAPVRCRTRSPPAGELARPLVVVIALWLIAFDVAVPVHNASGVLLTLSWIGFVLGNLIGGNGKHYLINPRTLPTDLWRQLRYYGYGIFVNEPHPFHVSREHKLNVLQTLSYVGVMFGLMPLVILSGWAFLLTTLKAMLTGWHRGAW